MSQAAAANTEKPKAIPSPAGHSMPGDQAADPFPLQFRIGKIMLSTVHGFPMFPSKSQSKADKNA
jgi:hypothetical protein